MRLILPSLGAYSKAAQQSISHQKPQLQLCRRQLTSDPSTRSVLSPAVTQGTLPRPSFSPQNRKPIRLFSTTASRPRDTNMTDATIESAKRAAAKQAVADHFDPSATNVGIGSGTTIVYVVEAIKEASTNPAIRFVPTGYQSRQVLVKAGLTPIAFDSLGEDVLLDVAFDGADEVDLELNCIKGGGACLFQEKLVAERARKFVCVAGISHLVTCHRTQLIDAFRLPKEAGPSSNKLAHHPHRSRTHLRTYRSPIPAHPRLQKPRTAHYAPRKVWSAQDRPGLLHHRCALRQAPHQRRRQGRQRQG
jgi:ribose 5-phosphate isomerase